MRYRFTDTPSVGSIGTMRRLPWPARRREHTTTHIYIHDQAPAASGMRTNPEGGEPDGQPICSLRRDRDGTWRGRDTSGRRWMMRENGGTLYVYPDRNGGNGNGDNGRPDLVRLETPAGAAREDFPRVDDPRSADRRRAGDVALATLDAHGPDHIEGLRSWQRELNQFYTRKS